MDLMTNIQFKYYTGPVLGLSFGVMYIVLHNKTRAALQAPGFRVPNGPAQWAHKSHQIVWGRAPPFAHE